MANKGNRHELDMSLVNSVNKSRQRTVSRDYQQYNHDERVTGRNSEKRSYQGTDYKDSYSRGTKNSKNSKSSKNGKKKKHRVLRTVLGFILVNAILIALAVSFVPGAKDFLLVNCGGPLLKCFVSEEDYSNIFDDQFGNDVVVNDGVDREKFKGFYTIALFGVDARDGKLDSGVNSDSIILVSINQDTGKVVMSSIYRDTWLQISTNDDTVKYRKINSAYSIGGAKSVINTLNKNMDLHISDYVTVNFQGLATIIDMLGGLDMTITEDERYYINHYIDETSAVTGIKASKVKEAGLVHLDGIQAVSYCRIRYCTYYYPDGTTVSNDMGRTARQRYVLSLMIDKAKSAGVSKVLDIVERVFKGEDNIIRTSISYDDMIDMIPVFLEFDMGETRGFPFTYDFPDSELTNGQSALVPGGLVYNVRKLHEFLYGDDSYIPSDDVIKIDGQLKKKTGVEDIEQE